MNDEDIEIIRLFGGVALTLFIIATVGLLGAYGLFHAISALLSWA